MSCWPIPSPFALDCLCSVTTFSDFLLCSLTLENILLWCTCWKHWILMLSLFWRRQICLNCMMEWVWDWTHHDSIELVCVKEASEVSKKGESATAACAREDQTVVCSSVWQTGARALWWNVTDCDSEGTWHAKSFRHKFSLFTYLFVEHDE